MAIRDHEVIEINEFMGLWRRGDDNDCPQDHFRDCENIQYEAGQGFKTRDGVDIYEEQAVPLGNILRIYNYPTQTANTLLVLITGGEIYHVLDPTTVFGPILTVATMTDFGFVQFAGRAYITPFKTYTDVEPNIEKGIENETLYVYSGDGATVARPAGVDTPVNAPGDTFVVTQGTGSTDIGFHIFGVVYETDTGAFSSIGPIGALPTLNSDGNGVSFADIPVSPSAFVTKRHLVATRVIPDYNGDETGYDFFFIPDGTINDNTSTTLSNISFFDNQLLEDASYLLDQYNPIPAGVNLSVYHNRLVLNTTFDDISICLVSAIGEPENISQIDGILIAPLDGNPLTITQDMRDILYGFKRNRTIAWTDNGDEPSSWPMSIIDYAMGAPVHGVAKVLDSGATSIDYLLVAAYQGIQIFNGTYMSPELSWKIKDFWFELDRELFRRIQMVNNPIAKMLYCTLPDYLMLVGDYNLDQDPMKIRWTVWRFDFQINTIAILNIDTLILGAEQALGA